MHSIFLEDNSTIALCSSLCIVNFNSTNESRCKHACKINPKHASNVKSLGEASDTSLIKDSTPKLNKKE